MCHISGLQDLSISTLEPFIGDNIFSGDNTQVQILKRDTA